MRISLLFSLMLTSLIAAGQAMVTPDSTFNGTGRNVFSVGGSLDFGDNIALQPDGKIIMTGASMNLGGWVSLGVCRLNPDGSFDNLFGTSGISLIDLGGLPSQGGFEPEIAIQPDGKILVCGYGWNGTDEDLFVCRLLPGGAPDPAFGTAGKVYVGMLGEGMPDAAYAITSDAAGNIYLTGSTRTGGTPFTNDLSIVKLTPSGSPDPSFSGDGKLLLDLSGSWDFGYGIAVTSDGKIIATGYSGFPADFFAIRLLPDGSLDPSFGTAGKTTIDIMGNAVADDCFGMVMTPDGKILLTGDAFDPASSSFVGALVRLTASGLPDTSFGGDGIVTLSASSESTIFYNAVVQPDGKYLVSGTASIGGNDDFVVARFNADGASDLSFNSTGSYTIDITGQAKPDRGYGLALQSDGRILLSGNTSVNEFISEKYSIVRLKAKEVEAAFTASSTLVCSGEQIQFFNSTTGNNLSYLWTFEGGTPSTSTQQNPTVTYTGTGIFDVKLVATNGTVSDSITKTDYIQVIATPDTPAIPAGVTAACQGQIYTYSTAAVAFANSYVWVVAPSAAGNITGNGPTATFTASPGFTGDFTIKVYASNQCGNSAWSDELSCTLSDMPDIFDLSGNGNFCEGSSGATLTLNGSETGVNYQLYLDNIPYGTMIPGTGSAISWSNLNDPGFYTALAMANFCSQQMAGQIYVSMISVPDQPATPEGSNSVCTGTTTLHSIDDVPFAASYSWSLSPSDAGTLTPDGTEVSIEWLDYTGMANLTVTAVNECGNSAPSPSLAIMVHDSPEPAITGPEAVCVNWNADYETVENAGSVYAWAVTGGEIISGAGTSSVVVNWNTTGTGTLTVNETNESDCTGNSAVFSVMVDPCVGTEDHSTVSSMMVFPNPSESNISVTFTKETGDYSYLVFYDAQGHMVMNIRVGKGISRADSIDLSNLKTGLYAMLYVNEGIVVSQTKVVKR